MNTMNAPAPEYDAGQDLDITGMTCAGCAGRIERALQSLPGVTAASVNLATERASVRYLRGAVALDDLVSAVRGAGYAATPAGDTLPDHDTDARRRDLTDLAIATVLTLPLVGQMVLMMLGVHFHLAPWMEAVLAAPVQFYVGRRFYRAAWAALRAGSGNMDQLVVLGTSTAYAYSLWNVITLGPAAAGHLYFEAAAVIITLILLGKVLEARAKRSTAAALRALMALRPETATVLRDGAEVEIPLGKVRLDDIVILRPGARLGVDGVIADGESDFDESLITGEPMPVPRRLGDSVIAGSINGAGLVRVQATRIGPDTTLARVARMVTEAQTGKAPIQRLVDRVAGIFVPVVLVIAALTLGGWLLAGAGIEKALIAMVSVLIIACPCALGLATPAALVAGTGAAARSGILVKDIAALERAGHIDMVVFDKTGTLTEGRPQVADIHPFHGTKDGLIALAAAAQAGSEHPLGRAMVEAAAQMAAPALPAASSFRAHVGSGVEAMVDGDRVLIGRADLAASDATPDQTAAANALASEGKTVVWISRAGWILGLIALTDNPRPDAASAIAALHARGVRTALLTGDNAQTAARIAQALGISHVEADARPEDKAARIAALMQGGARVAMVGDGINDAPALATADLGIAMGSGADVAMETAGVALMRPRPALVADALDIARATGRKIRQNLFWAFAYNVVLIPVAAAGLLNPMLAGAAMAASSLSVLGNALLLTRWRSQADK